MFYINKYIFNDVCDRNMDIYDEFISCIREEYIDIIKNLTIVKTVTDIRFQIHKLATIINNLHANELMYICKLTLLNDKNNKNITVETYRKFIQQIIDYDKSKIGL